MLHDLDPDFIEAISLAAAWEYNSLYEWLHDQPALIDDYREEEFNRQRPDCAVRALAGAAKRYGVPYEFRKLDCNGQRKLLVKAGRVLLIQEPIASIQDQPTVAEYKRQLADVHGFVRQLELELGDQPHRIRDWSGCVLGVLLHGPTGKKFSREQKSLGTIMLAVPNAEYDQWVLRLDLHTIAMFGRSSVATERADSDVQEDNVVVTAKKRPSEETA